MTHPKNFRDESGNTYGRLIVISRNGSEKDTGAALWLCQCECGNTTTTSGVRLRKGETKSCGCLHKIIAKSTVIKRSTTHGESGHGKVTKEYTAWIAMRDRCNNSNNPHFKHYGGRGIVVCDRWQHSYQNFIEDVGRKPSLTHSLDRINVHGNYEPNNVRWASPKEQVDNRRYELALAEITKLKAIIISLGGDPNVT